MIKNNQRLLAFLLITSGFAVASAGCELIASVDRSKIPSDGSGGSGGAGGATSSTGGAGGMATSSTGGGGAASSSSSTGGTGGMTTSSSSTGGTGGMATSSSSTGGTGGMTTSSTGGTGGMATSSSSTGGGGAASSSSTGTGCATEACASPTDCPATGNECIGATCTTSCCGTTDLGASHVFSTGQTIGDCQSIVCDGSGGTTSIDDVTDLPGPAATLCLVDPSCAGSPAAPHYSFAVAGTDCTADVNPPNHLCGGGLNAGTCVACNSASDCTGGGTCNGSTFTPATTCSLAGACVPGTPVDCAATGKGCLPITGCTGCASASDCPPTGNECVVATCTATLCGTQDLGNSHTLSTGQTPGDCQKIVCDGSGGTTQVDDATDIPTPTSVCQTNPTCAGPSPLTPSFSPAATGTSCVSDNNPPNQVCGDTNNSLIAGTCVQCNSDADCLSVNDAGTLACNTSTGQCQ